MKIKSKVVRVTQTVDITLAFNATELKPVPRHLSDFPKPSAWPSLRDKRTLREHQDAAVTEMQAAHDAGVMGHFLWGTVGIGKTLIVAKFMDWLRSRHVLAPVVLWILPKSAMLGVINELKGEGGWEVDILVPKRRDDREYRAHLKAGARVFWKGQLRMRPRVGDVDDTACDNGVHECVGNEL